MNMRVCGCSVGALALAAASSAVMADVTIVPGTGVGTALTLVFPHTMVTGATGIDFEFAMGISPVFPDPETNALVIDFMWGPTATGPWTISPDNVTTVHGGVTNFFDTGIYHGVGDAPFVALQFYAGGLMFVSGTFTHTSVPDPSAAALLGVGAMAAIRRRRV